MEARIQSVKSSAVEECSKIESLAQLQQLWVKYLGKKGEVTQLLRSMGSIPADQRPVVGQMVNQLKVELEQLYEQKEAELEKQIQQKRLQEEALDITLPGRKPKIGSLHPLTLVLNEIKQIFISMGYQAVEGPEIELDYYNFEALNIPKDHPARDMQDTFYITEDFLLRSHTSPVQIHVMERQDPPVRIIVPGKVYRADSDLTHSPMFHQVEGLLVDAGITFADLKGTLEAFAKAMFGPETRIRFRPSYFPFTEPSAEVDVSCIICRGTGCKVCSNTGWLEILGSGMVDPRVLEKVGYDTEKVSGLAFGMGIERVAMLKYGINDIRLFFTNDQRFLHQFK
ncbi:MAG: phenylalanine--tRNA ligase subunit alpha [Firmicutes bacterium]|nr:phenylalanine--tRNA ligase subunit alpha [Bacillota bacterium]NLL87739.1 phenylalanine--tRNA ligase subunit alpha [Bacillota bacterium]HKM17626.1 phenylalanine--tRNA ligase subunit alpha [Limnochordia bacterium]